MSTPDGPAVWPNNDPRLRAARYQDGVDLESLAALSGRALDDLDAEAADSTEDLIPRRPGSEAARLSATVEAVARTAVDRAIAAGAFEHLAYAGKPLPDIVASTDPEWWTKSLLRREEVHSAEGLGPEALLLRVVDAHLDEDLDALHSERQVREALESFNRRIIEARRQLLGGPPVITPLRDVEASVTAWHSRRAQRAHTQQPEPAAAPGHHRKWFRRTPR